jgi:hypothetical protein
MVPRSCRKYQERRMTVVRQIALAAVILFVPTEMARDLVFVPPPRGDFSSTTEIHFNGDWRGVKLCRGKVCRNYEEIFP